MTFLGLLSRSRTPWEPREWPRRREGGLRDERDWVASLSDRELADLAAGLAQVDRAVAGRKPEVDVGNVIKLPKRGQA